MRKSKRKKLSKKSLITRIIIYSGISFLSIVSFSLVPKILINKDSIYEAAVKYAVIDDADNLSMHHYDVFANKTKFDKAIEEDVPKYKNKFIKKNDVLVVKVNGENSVMRYKDYIFIKNEDIPPLNIEYHMAKNLQIKDNSLPIATFIVTGQDLAEKVNKYIYNPLLIIIHLAILIPFLINDCLYIKELENRRYLFQTSI